MPRKRGKRKSQSISDARRLQLLVSQLHLDRVDGGAQLWKRGILEAQQCNRLSAQHRANPACRPFARILYSCSGLPCLFEAMCLKNGLDVSKMLRWTFRVFESASTTSDYSKLRARHFEQLYAVLLAASTGGFQRRLRGFCRDQQTYAPKTIVLSWQHFGDTPGELVAFDYTHLNPSVWRLPCSGPEDAGYLGAFLAQRPADAVPLLAQWVTLQATSCLVALLRAECIRLLPERRQCGNLDCSQHGRYRCSRCGQDYYCSLACQRLAFPVHASECRNRYETKVLARELVTHVREITVVQLVIDFVKTQVA